MNLSRSLARRIFRPGSPLLEEAELVHHTASAFPDGRDAHGNYVPGLVTTTPIQVATSPIEGEAREVLPEALRSEETRHFWTSAPVQSINAETGQDADIVKWDGAYWRAEVIEEWGTDLVQVLGRRIETEIDPMIGEVGP